MSAKRSILLKKSDFHPTQNLRYAAKNCSPMLQPCRSDTRTAKYEVPRICLRRSRL